MNCRKCKKEIPGGSKFCCYCGIRQDREPRKALKRPNGTGTVYKLQGRRHHPWVAAKSKVIIGYFETKTAAIETLNRLSGHDLSERYNMTFNEVFEAWKLEHYKEITAAGQQSYDTAFEVFKTLHKKVFRTLRTADFQRVVDQHMHKSHSTVSKYKQLLTQMSKWAMREEIIATNLASFVRVPANVKKEKEIFTDEDILKLEKDGSEAARIVLMLLATGMRIGELFSLPLKDYHGTYIIGGEKTEAGRNRNIPIRPEGRCHFEYFASIANGYLLLSGYVGEKVAANFRRRDYYPLLERLKIERKTPHATRHTYTTRAVKENMKPEILQKILGHANYSTTADVYTHVDIDTIVAAVEPVSNLLVTEIETG